MNSSFAKPLALAALALAALAVPLAPMAAAETASDPAHLAAGKALFEDWGCGSCHALADAGATAHVGPAFDGNPGLTKDFAIVRISNGQGAMPAFAGSMTDEEIDTLADYIVAKKAQ